MIKQFGFALPALLCFASPGFARQPYAYDMSDTQSVLIRADDTAIAADSANVNESAPMPQAQVGSFVAPPPNAAVDGTVVESAPITSTQPSSTYQSSTYPSSTYRTVRPARRSNGLAGDLIELERRKNAWLRRTFVGR